MGTGMGMGGGDGGAGEGGDGDTGGGGVGLPLCSCCCHEIPTRSNFKEEGSVCLTVLGGRGHQSGEVTAARARSQLVTSHP